MTTLRNLLAESNIFSTDQQRSACIEIMAFRQCFDKSIITAESKNENVSQKQRERAEKALTLWPEKLSSQSPSIDDILEAKFNSLEDAADWFCNVADVGMLRKSFDHEGLQADRENKAQTNLERWDLSTAIDIDEIEKEKDSPMNKILQLAKTLQFIDEFKFPEEPVKVILIHGCLEFALEERIKYVVKHLSESELSSENPFLIFNLTGNRFVFNHEKSLAEILASASFLNVPDKVEKIREVLNTSKEDWLKGSDILKQKILIAVGRDKWPDVDKVNSRYNENPEIYKRPDGSSIQGWPVAMDLTDYLFKREIEKYPRLKDVLTNNQVKLLAAVSQGKEDKIATTQGVVEGWYIQYGKDLLNLERQKGKKKLAIIAIVDNLTHDILRQGEITADVLKKYDPDYEVFPVGPAAKKISLRIICDTLAKYFYMKITSLLEKLKKEKTKVRESKDQPAGRLDASAKAVTTGPGLYPARTPQKTEENTTMTQEQAALPASPEPPASEIRTYNSCKIC